MIPQRMPYSWCQTPHGPTMLVSSSGWAHSPITLIFTALSAVYWAALAAGAAPSATATKAASATPIRFKPLLLLVCRHTLEPVRTGSNRLNRRHAIPAFLGLSSANRCGPTSSRRRSKLVEIEPDLFSSVPAPMTLLPAQRRQEMLRAVRGGTAHVSDLAESFGVSEMTVRRDLHALARAGKLERVHGGAVDHEREPGFSQIEVERFDVKDRLGAAAAALVEDGQTVMIDIGTSTLQMARHLHGKKITVVTTNLAVMEELLPDPDIELVLPGGIVRRNYRSLVGVLAEDSLRQLKSDIAFIGCSGVDAEMGVWDTTMIEVPIKRLMIAGADLVVLIADVAKFAMTGVVRVCGPESIDHVVTDAPLPAACRSAVDAAGIEVTVA